MKNPNPPSLAEGEVHVWRIDLAAPHDPALLSPADLARAAAYGAPETRRQFAASRAALRRILGSYVDQEPAALPIAEGPHRKPFLDLPGAPDFSLSHTAETALLAFARGRAVGIDIERWDRPRLDMAGVAARFFSPAEADHWKKTGANAANFLRIWTRKEAILKADGGGWTAGGAGFSVVSGEEDFFWRPVVAWKKSHFTLAEIEAGAAFCAALATADSLPAKICYFAF